MTYAVWLMYAGAALSVVGGAIGAVTAHSLASAWIMQLQHSLPAGQSHVALPSVGLMTRFFTIALIAGGIIDALLWLWMAWKNGQGRSWARVLSTVFFGFLCVGTLSSVVNVTGAAIGSLLLGLVNFAVGLIVIVMLWRRESTSYYQAVKMQAFGGYPPVPGGYYGYGTPQSTYGYGYPPPPPNPEDPPPYPSE